MGEQNKYQSKPFVVTRTRWVEKQPFLFIFFSEPSFGHFNKDGLIDVVIEEDIGNNTKRVS